MREDPSSGFSSGSELSDELRLLCMLHNIGATESGRSLTLQQISEWTKMDTPALESHLQKLIGLGYVQFVQADGTSRYHLTLDGIRKVLSIYS
jgi:DNA-binding IclR family transcriptional regulator